MRDSLRTFCLRQLYKNPTCSSKELIELAVQNSYCPLGKDKDNQAQLLSALVGIPREERLGNNRFFPGGLGEFRAYDSLVSVLAQGRTLDTTLLRPLIGAINLALHQDRRFYCLEDGSWYLQHQTIVNDELFTALQEKNAGVSLREWLETFSMNTPGTAPIFWSLDPRFVLEGEHVRLHTHCTLLGQEVEQLWPEWESHFAHGARVTTESLSKALLQRNVCVPSSLALEQALALKGVYPIGHNLWMQETFIPDVPSVGGAVAFRVSDSLQEEPLAFPSLMVLDSLGIGEVVLTAAHRIYGVLPISWNKTERRYAATGLGLGLGLGPEDNTFEVWHKDGFLFSEALAQRLALLAPGQRLRLSLTEDGLFFELRGFDARIAKAQGGLFSREELLLPHSALKASFLQQLQAEPEGINLSALIEGLRPDYTLSEITQALTSPWIERGPGGFCRFRPLSFDLQEVVLTLLPTSSEVSAQEQIRDLHEPQRIPGMAEAEEVLIAEGELPLNQEKAHSAPKDALLALLDESPEPQGLEEWTEFQNENLESSSTLEEAEQTLSPALSQELDQAQVPVQVHPHQAIEESLNDAPSGQISSLESPIIPTEAMGKIGEKVFFSPLSLEELFSAPSEEGEEFSEITSSIQDVQTLEEESEEGLAELIHSLYSEPEDQSTHVQPIASALAEVQAAPQEDQDQEEHPSEVLPTTQEGYLELIRAWKQEGAIPVEQAEPINEVAEEKPVVLETQRIATDTPAIVKADETIHLAPEPIAQLVDPEEILPGLPEQKEDPSQPVVTAELLAGVEEQGVFEIQPLAINASELLEADKQLTSEPIVQSLLLEDLALALTGEKLVAPVEPIAQAEVPIVLEIQPVVVATPTLPEKVEEVVQLSSEPLELLNLEDLVLDLTGEKIVAFAEPIAEMTLEAPVPFEIRPIVAEDDAFVPLEEVHESIRAALDPVETEASFLWLDELRMNLTQGEESPQKPTEISSEMTTASPEAIAFLHTLFEEESDELLTEKHEETDIRPPASLQAKLDQLVSQRKAIQAQRRPAWTALMQAVMAQAALSTQQQEEFQGFWMGTRTVQESNSLCASVEPYLCHLTVLNRLPVEGSLDEFVQGLKEHVVLGEVDPSDVLESLILPALRYQRTAKGWAQKSA